MPFRFLKVSPAFTAILTHLLTTFHLYSMSKHIILYPLLVTSSQKSSFSFHTLTNPSSNSFNSLQNAAPLPSPNGNHLATKLALILIPCQHGREQPPTCQRTHSSGILQVFPPCCLSGLERRCVRAALHTNQSTIYVSWPDISRETGWMV